jgi:methionyl-tRNA formyltransferase
MEKEAIKLRTVFMGTSSFANTILEALIFAQYNIVAIYTQPDRKIGRDQRLQKTSTKITAEKNNIAIFSPDKFGKDEIAALSAMKPDLIIVVAYGKILPKVVLDLPGFGAINIHASLLPLYRGASPIQNAILDGRTETGTTIMLMDENVDTGAILGQRKVAIDRDDTIIEVTQKLLEASESLLLEVLPLWVRRTIEPKEQDDSQATLCQLIERSDGRIIWENDGLEIYNQYRSFYNWPGIYTFWDRGNANIRIKLNKIAFVESGSEVGRHLGEVFKLNDEIAVNTGDWSSIILKEIQPEGRNNMNIKDFLNGNPTFLGSILK